MIKVRAGQVWEGNHSKAAWQINFINDDDWISYGQGSYVASPMPKWQFITSFKFIPQNDLEFAAVTLNEWYFPCDHLRVEDGVLFHASATDSGAIHRQQWQNMRYHLGQDTKPHCRLVKGEWVKQ